MLWLLPLVIAVALLVPVALAPVSRRADLLLSRVALPIFGYHVANRSTRRPRQEQLLRAAYVGETHRVYASRTLLLSALFAISGSIFGVYGLSGITMVLALTRDALAAALPGPLTFLADVASLEQASPGEAFLLFLLSGGTVGSGLAIAAYWARWELLRQRAQARAREINSTLPRTVAFVYALSGSGVPF
ncbi:MAG: secretion system protein, partial [Haloferacaceae archaeon]